MLQGLSMDSCLKGWGKAKCAGRMVTEKHLQSFAMLKMIPKVGQCNAAHFTDKLAEVAHF